MNSQEEPFFYVKSEHRLIKVVLNKLLFVECVKDYMKLHMQDQRPIMTLLTMKTLEEHLPQPQFMRIHRSIIVQTSKIDSINKGSVNIGGFNLPISNSYRESFFSYIEKYTLE
ncbi:MAG: LytTR family transcriptional regulator DNA-binding domain-containing protein [Bacteroidaceae bacterium]|jgi:DNA-binding LytR/AlgR family response regulator|nr:LytTR family transcriptional regulator DNA-binding domain-containing protein [Bacteroidaceae bacterium]